MWVVYNGNGPALNSNHVVAMSEEESPASATENGDACSVIDLLYFSREYGNILSI